MTPLDRLLLLLAGSGLSFKEIVELAAEVRRMSAFELAQKVEELRPPFKSAQTNFNELVSRQLRQKLVETNIPESLRSSTQAKDRTRHFFARDITKQHDKFVPTRAAWENVAARVEQLLKEEAGLSTTQAHDALARSLMLEGALRPENLPPLPPKKGLHYWVSKLDPYVPARVVLQHATRIRNAVVHEPKKAWEFSSRTKG